MPDMEATLRLVSQGMQAHGGRHNAIKDTREIRYGRDDVLDTIPEELRSTDFEYHDMSMNQAVLDLTAFLSASSHTWRVNPPKDRDAAKADEVEQVLEAVFGQNGILEVESGNEVAFTTWQNQVENGHGIYKFTLKKGYPLRMPQQKFLDEASEDYELEANPDYNPQSRKDGRDKRRETKYRERTDALDSRRDSFMRDEFGWQWRAVDPTHYFSHTQDGVRLIEGEVTMRPASILKDHGLGHLMELSEGYAFMGEPDGPSSTPLVQTYEVWTGTHGYFGFLSLNAGADGLRETTASAREEMAVWKHPYGRPPYYHALGLPNTDRDPAYRLGGAFDRMISEIPLLNHLETMHFNAVHRGFFPIYQLVRDPAFRGDIQPLEAEQLVAVTEAAANRQEPPPGWRYEITPSGFEPDLTYQLQAARERVKDSAIAAVLTGTSPGAGDSGAKISLLINAAARAISPFVRHHQRPLQEMARTFLDVSKRLSLDTNVTVDEKREDGQIRAKQLTLRSNRIVSTSAEVNFNIQLPVDAAADETRGITMVDTGKMSYETAAERYFNIGDPTKEMERIRLGRRDLQIDDIAFQQAALDFETRAPSIFSDFIGGVSPLPAPSNTAGGGPNGAFGGASALLGRGAPASPSASQADIGGA